MFRYGHHHEGGGGLSDRFTHRELEQFASMLKPLLDGLLPGMKDDPTLAPEFRCPNDGSSRTCKISALLALRPQGTVSGGGRTILYRGGSQAIDILDPGSEPRSHRPFLYLGWILVGVGVLSTLLPMKLLGCLGLAPIALGVGVVTVAWVADWDLESRHAVWKEKVGEAQTHWWCEACHGTFLPESKLGIDLEEAAQGDDQTGSNSEASNKIEPLKRPD